ncbi:Kelch repeat-containing proteins [Plasmopara halstedii]|uniref:Kelch repeat-containing proteins n=1 Tax=Plasmopara halstedii TaxID=4781 RepID=A0A0P1AQM4_PLAHL|nr:Kelch repeat-containing proteins [Plasmopara halstedii]CEG43878.1 Kelch repeat-containing proteins [Plasmopara halstedii]|eukprot:XP_024580247.1 Kelch repeat-containing proteins [Plasmopara halstedii]
MKGCKEKVGLFSNRKSSASTSQASRVSLQWSVPTLSGKPPSARGGHSSVITEAHLLIFGGHHYGSAGGFVYLNDLHRLNLKTSSWEEMLLPKELSRSRQPIEDSEKNMSIELPAPRYGHSAILLNEDKRMFIFGGRGVEGEAFRDIYFFDLKALAWMQVQWTTDSPAGRYGHAVASVDKEKMFIFGGWDGKKSMNDMWSFNSKSFTWRRPKCSGQPPTPRHNLSMIDLNQWTGVDDGLTSLLLYGGYTVVSNALPVYNKDVYILNVADLCWSRPRLVGEYPPGSFGQSMNLAGATSEAKIALILGGWSGTDSTPLFIGDKQVRDLVRETARKERILSNENDANERTEKRNRRKRKMQHEQDLRCASSHARVLDLQAMEWHCVSAHGVAVANRYGHTSNIVGRHVFLFGGWDGNRALDQLVVGELSIDLASTPISDC